MANYGSGPRGKLKSGKRRIAPFGVVHRVRPNDDLFDFFSDLEKEASQLEKVQFTDDNGRVTKEKNPVVFFNPRRLRLRIVEKSLTESIGRANRFKWHSGDKARIQQSVADEAGRFVISGGLHIAQMSVVPSLGDAELADAGYHSVSIGPSAETSEAQFFAREHEIAVNGLKRRQPRDLDAHPVKASKIAQNPYVPHISIGRVVHGTPPDLHTKVIKLVQTHLPLDVQLEPLEFTPTEY